MSELKVGPELIRQRGRLARLVSLFEERPEHSLSLLAQGEGEPVPRIGFAGPPGSGKSTLIAKLLPWMVDEFGEVAVLAVDPTSEVTGGALLGDRIRAIEEELPERVFFRSLASRGSLGGLSASTAAVARLMERAGFGAILLETVGVGQISCQIAELADTVVTVISPEAGDGVQVLKAGLFEVSDIFVVNKADRQGAELMRRNLEEAVEMGSRPEDGWRPRVVVVSALEGKNLDELSAAISQHIAYLKGNQHLTERRRRELVSELRGYFMDRAAGLLLSPEGEALLARLSDRVSAGEMGFSEVLSELARFVSEQMEQD